MIIKANKSNENTFNIKCLKNQYSKVTNIEIHHLHNLDKHFIDEI